MLRRTNPNEPVKIKQKSTKKEEKEKKKEKNALYASVYVYIKVRGPAGIEQTDSPQQNKGCWLATPSAPRGRQHN